LDGKASFLTACSSSNQLLRVQLPPKASSLSASLSPIPNISLKFFSIDILMNETGELN
jgi:hypothetical protein